MPADAELGENGMAIAMERAQEIGLVYNDSNPLHMWAVALLHTTTQFNDLVIGALLQSVFEGQLGVVVITRYTVKVYNGDPLKPPKKQHCYELRDGYQPSVLPEAILAIGVMLESADPTYTNEGSEYVRIVTNEAETRVATQLSKGRGTRRTEN